MILTISDHLEWDEENEHIYMLQEKINEYLMAIESGQLNDKYPASTGKQVEISIALKYEPNENGILFLTHVEKTLTEAGYGFSYYIFN